MTVPKLVVTRDYPHPPETVFDAWLDPDSARHWLFTTADSEMAKAEIDPRPGGKFLFVDRRPDHGDIEHVGEYLEIDRPRRIVFTFGVPKFSDEMTRVTIDIEPRPRGCRLTLIHERVPDEWRDQTEQGWTMILGALADRLG